ncbi:leucine-rich repeat domain-containing protein [Ruminococcus albus]|uniref:leucine-rich repeat domain-containing protein n=1 Tax=Ruminococcus albus TaxID=1264 RepID=UPI0004630F33|nr:leucine-rich repeat domain-containing protein [Ruminococcus albus]
MKSKKIISGLLALTFVFGGTALPNTVVNNSVAASASEEESSYESFGDYIYTLHKDGTVEILQYMGLDAKEVEIPAEINGAPVTCIGESAFNEYDDDHFEKITSIVIPDSVTVIKAGAFEHCSSLENITLPENLKYIGDFAFYKTGIKNFVIPDSVEYIGYSAFCYCFNLESITLPKNLENIECGTFDTCCKLRSIKLPENLKNIDESAFAYCLDLEDINIPDSVESIGYRAFVDCENLKSVTIPKSIEETGICSDAFSYYDELTDTYKPLKKLIINCYKDSGGFWYALGSGNSFNVIDADDSKTKYPELIKEEYSSKYRQFRLKWTAVEGAEKYGIAVKLAGKWKVQAYTDADTRTYTSPKLSASKSYKVVICAKVNGKWEANKVEDIFNNRTFPLVVR